MFIFYLIFGILLIGLFLSQFIKVFFEKDTPNYQRYMNVVIYLIVIVTSINLILAIVSYIKTRNMIGQTGDPGIRGPQGKQGRAGQCNNVCGQKTCYINVVEYANKIFDEEYQKLSSPSTTAATTTSSDTSKKTINNRQFLKRLNKICHSNQYRDILLAKHDKKPTEKKLIEYIKKIVKKWIILIVKFNPDGKSTLDNRLGIKFLSERNFSEKLLNTRIKKIAKENRLTQNSPFNEIKKYDIWEWSEPYKVKRAIINIDSTRLDLPEPDQPILSIMKSNNYQPKFKANVKNDVWDTTFCPHNQMGEKKDNPNKLDKCVFIDDANGLKQYKETWKKTQFQKPKGLSLYNSAPFKNKNNQIFYPVGSVWRGKNDTTKPDDATRMPDSINMCGKGHGKNRAAKFSDFGPEKETILVSGDVKSPTDYDLVWDSNVGCPNCFTENIKIWRPIAPKGYTCLGDVTTNSSNSFNTKTGKPTDLDIKCVPSKCVQEKKMGAKVWDNRNVSENTYNNYKEYYKRTPAKSNKSISMSVWSAGANNSGEENINLYGTPLEEDDGYNLFRVGRGIGAKPETKDGKEIKTYVINKECLMPAGGKKPVHPKLNAPMKNPYDGRFDDKHYFGTKPPMAILTNIDNNLNANTQSLNGPTDKKKKLYLIDDLNKRKDNEPDTYFIKTFNEKKNDFSSCLATNVNKEVIVKENCNKDNDYFKWHVDYTNDTTDTVKNAKIKLKTKQNYPDDSTQYCLQQYYDNNGQSQYKLANCSTLGNNYNWKYNTLVQDTLPQKIN